ncbi:hypothetical protein CRUP_004654 [Coryphaenoides rupestris]|nr:hypothetical protein CRUP_004654 [Coryphaenoides rupestris]
MGLKECPPAGVGAVMSLGKLPGFKGLAVPGSQGGKQRFRSDLSVDMISPPMADFRHTMHVGRGGDVFGDTSFLSNHGGRREEPESPDPGFFTRTFRHVRARNPESRARGGGSRELSSSPPPPPISPIIKNAISLPQLNVLDGHNNGCLQRALLFPTSASTNEAFYGYDPGDTNQMIENMGLKECPPAGVGAVMSLGKLPGFKGLAVPGSQGGKQRFRSDLSVDMISPPMADFRHTMHVGRGGDVFGDTSFLSNHGGRREEPESPDPGFFTRTFRHVRARNPESRARGGGSRELSSSPPPPPISPIIKNAISLPQLNVLDGHNNGCLQRALLFPTSASTNEAFYGYAAVVAEATPTCSDSLTDLTDFTFDLGPSLMSEILSLIDSRCGLLGGGIGG